MRQNELHAKIERKRRKIVQWTMDSNAETITLEYRMRQALAIYSLHGNHTQESKWKRLFYMRVMLSEFLSICFALCWFDTGFILNFIVAIFALFSTLCSAQLATATAQKDTMRMNTIEVQQRDTNSLAVHACVKHLSIGCNWFLAFCHRSNRIALTHIQPYVRTHRASFAKWIIENRISIIMQHFSI